MSGHRPSWWRRKLESSFKACGGVCPGCDARMVLLPAGFTPGQPRPRNAATLDHIVPKSKGGATRWGNLRVRCFRCNVAKADAVPHYLTTREIRSKSKRRRAPEIQEPTP